MPHAYVLVKNTFTLPAGATQNLDLDLNDMVDVQLMTEIAYTATASSTGVSLNLIPGFGGPDTTYVPVPFTMAFPVVYNAGVGSTVPVFSDNSDSVTMTSFTASSGTLQTKKTSFFFNTLLIRYPRWVRMQFTNTDPTNAATVKVYGDV